MCPIYREKIEKNRQEVKKVYNKNKNEETRTNVENVVRLPVSRRNRIRVARDLNKIFFLKLVLFIYLLYFIFLVSVATPRLGSEDGGWFLKNARG